MMFRIGRKTERITTPTMAPIMQMRIGSMRLVSDLMVARGARSAEVADRRVGRRLASLQAVGGPTFGAFCFFSRKGRGWW